MFERIDVQLDVEGGPTPTTDELVTMLLHNAVKAAQFALFARETR